MSECLSENMLVEFLEGNLSQEQALAIRAHLAECADCQALAQDCSDAPGPLPETLAGSSPGTPAAPRREPPREVEEYRLIRPLGRGAMGQVHLGHDTLLDRKVAIKFMDAPQIDASGRERFLVEARAIARLSHPNVVTIHRVGEKDGWPFLVSEYILGRSLAELAKPMQSSEVVRIGIDLSRGLAAAHRHGVLHRDIKPANAMMAEDGSVKLLDFGLAKLLESTPQFAASLSADQVPKIVSRGADSDDVALSDTLDSLSPISANATSQSPPPGNRTSLTQTGTLIGTPSYLAPEIWKGQPATSRSDVYSLGALLYELASGRRPHEASSMRDLEQRATSQPPPSLRGVAPSVDPRLAAIIDRCLALSPAFRFESGITLCQALEALTATAPATSPTLPARSTPPRRIRWPWLVAPAVAIAGLGSAMFLSRLHKPSMVTIPGGSFQMGSTSTEIDAAFLWYRQHSPDFPRDLVLREQPRRTVQISTFRLDTVEVSNAEFAGWLNTQSSLRLRDDRWAEIDGVLLADLYPPYTPWHGLLVQDGHIAVPSGTEHKPATQLTWEAARRYCAAHGKRLPTEAEWEFAARGRKDNRFPWGMAEPTCDAVVFGRGPGQSCAKFATGPGDVGTAPGDRTPQGVYDLGGNVSEWVEDEFSERYPPCGECRDPRAPGPSAASDALRIFRGGNFLLSAPASRVASRSRWEANQGLRNVGFRCALSGA